MPRCARPDWTNVPPGSVRRTRRPPRGRSRRSRAEAPGDERRGGAAEHRRLAGARPSASPRRKPAENASPQPVVSTTSISNAGTRLDAVGVDEQHAVGPARGGDAARRRARPARGSPPRGRLAREAEHLLVVGQEVVEVRERGRDPVEQPGSPGARMSAEVDEPALARRGEDLRGGLAAHELRAAEVQVGGGGDRRPSRRRPARRCALAPTTWNAGRLAVGADRQHAGRGLHVVAAHEQRRVEPARSSSASSISPDRVGADRARRCAPRRRAWRASARCRRPSRPR